MPILIDSDVLIDHLRGKPQARAFLRASLDKELNICSVITQAEILAGMRSGEESKVRALLSLFELQPVTEAIADDAVNMWSVMKTTGSIHNLTDWNYSTWPSAKEIIISATRNAYIFFAVSFSEFASKLA